MNCHAKSKECDQLAGVVARGAKAGASSTHSKRFAPGVVNRPEWVGDSRAVSAQLIHFRQEAGRDQLNNARMRLAYPDEVRLVLGLFGGSALGIR